MEIKIKTRNLKRRHIKHLFLEIFSFKHNKICKLFNKQNRFLLNDLKIEHNFCHNERSKISRKFKLGKAHNKISNLNESKSNI